MSGKHKTLEKLLRDKALHLGGDISHYFHDTLKQFYKLFENFAEQLFNDIHWETKYSTKYLSLI